MKLKPRKRTGARTNEISEREIRHRNTARRIATEGMVLLENNGVLPLAKGSKIALYGGGASYTIKGGTGSGAVNNRSNVSITEGLKAAGFALTTQDWLEDYEARYQKAREEWMKYIYSISVPGDFMSLYTAHASHPLPMPSGKTITATDTDTAIYVISRVSGEGADRKAAKGDYYLSDVEEAELQMIQSLYKNLIVILNVGGVIDTAFTEKYHIAALVLMSQAGMEGGHALADLLCGDVTPSGKLTDTWAMQYEDYPSSATFSHNNGNVIEEKYTEGIYVGYRYFDSFGVKPRYPFGYGLSYTTFQIEAQAATLSKGTLTAKIKVTNTGTAAGREVVFLFASCPAGKIKKEQKRLIGYAKTSILQPGESELLILDTDLHSLESYHAGTSSYYLEKGDYYIIYGTSAADEHPLVTLSLTDTVNMQELDNICPLLDALKEIRPGKEREAAWRAAYAEAFRTSERIAMEEYLEKRNLPEKYENQKTEMIAEQTIVPAREQNTDSITEWNHQQIAAKARSIRSQLTLAEKALLCCGKQQGNDNEIVGNASGHVPGAAGETTTVLLDKYQIANIVMADGPAGIRIQQCYRVNPETGSVYRMTPYQGLQNRIFGIDFEFEGAEKYYQYCTAIPVGTLLAQTFDRSLLEECGEMIAAEMEEFGLTLWLAPGMNIHRNPLCGRNFEYYSEDPLVSGQCAAAITRGVQKTKGIGTTIKHFACNNQEENRRGVNSIVSEQALREIYLKGFEIAVRESQPFAIMTSYNKVNGVHTANSKDLCTQLARTEWGFQGIIMTDWTTTNSDGGSSAAKCIASGNDLVMPGNSHDVQEIIDAVNHTGDQKISMEALDACCDRMLEMILKSNRYE